jgi:hypothetical protein
LHDAEYRTKIVTGQKALKPPPFTSGTLKAPRTINAEPELTVA